MIAPTPEAVRHALARHRRVTVPALPGRTNHLETGVLLPISWTNPQSPVVIATLRTPHLRHHAGEVCFPGGRPERDDRDLEQTALREAREELGIAHVDVLGPLSSIPLYTSDYRLFPFVGAVSDHDLSVNPREVAEVLRVAIVSVLAEPVIEAIPWSYGGMEGLSPIFRIGERVMFGATAHVLHELLLVCAPLFGTEAPPLTPSDTTWEDVLPQHPPPVSAP